MRLLKTFEEYLAEGIITNVSPNFERADSLKYESERKFKLLKTNIKKLGIDDDNSNDYVEYCYNILLFLIRSIMFEEGFSSSGHGAHEAEVAFIKNLGCSDSEIRFLDQLRYFRNGILYYGKRFDQEYAEKVISFTEKLYFKLKK